jgi:DNA helicase II / ATP-dependent DNA helicase PcrA
VTCKELTRDKHLYLAFVPLSLSESESAFCASTPAVSGKNAYIWGPPGCGKTTYISRQVAKAAQKYGSTSVIVSSFTKAAASELAMRNLPIPPDNVGTLHALCYRALEHPEIAEGKVADWNKDHPEFRLSPSSHDVDEMEPEFTIYTFGDELYGRLQILRAKMEPADKWPAAVRRFATAWDGWKGANGLLDFTELLEVGVREFKIAPGNPRVIFVDEAQDLSRLQLALVRQWGRHADHVVLAGDDDQAVLTFAGSDPEALLDRSDPDFFRHVLSQSYRVPRRIHALSQMWIEKLTVREPKEYKPRDYEGELRFFHKGGYKTPDAAVDDAEPYLANGKSVMYLATCAYMLEPLKRTLRKRGLPFYNPYRRKRLDWNPLAPVKHGTSPVERLCAFLRPRPESMDAPWVGDDLRKWADRLRVEGVLRPGAAEMIQKLRPTEVVTIEILCRLFEPDCLDDLARVLSEEPLDKYTQWWLDHLAVKKRKQAEYPVRVAVRQGVKSLTATPKIIIGTGHSVKGGEADVVYIFPDISASGMRQWDGRPKDRDAVIRLGYVMMTRARETVVICEPCGNYNMPLAVFAAKALRA